MLVDLFVLSKNVELVKGCSAEAARTHFPAQLTKGLLVTVEENLDSEACV
jgi:hypothetical protein